MDAPTSKKGRRKHYTALVYFHGIGEQRRYEEVSRLSDGLESYDKEFALHNKRGPYITSVESKSENARTNLSRDTVEYLQVAYKSDDGEKEYRLYEAYYADLIAGGIRPTEVFGWLLSLSLMPLRILFTQWRDLPRLRRATLLGNWEQATGVISTSSEDCETFLNAYDNFENEVPMTEEFSKLTLGQKLWSIVGRDPQKSFRQYLNHLQQYLQSAKVKDSDHKPDLSKVSWWLRRFILVQSGTFAVILTILLTLGLIEVGLVSFIAQIHTLPRLWSIAGGTGILFAGWGLGWFLRNYVGDLYFWCTYQETSEKHAKREQILNHCKEYLKHVLLDKYCDRVVLVGHSMGTTVAYETILRLARQNPQLVSAEKPKQYLLAKIQHFVTLASVIDKVYYLFETETSKSYRYSQLTEALRYDLGNFPFSEIEDKEVEQQKPRIHWINIWDRADVASSRLYTPTNHKFKPHHVVDNYEVASNCFPDPVSGHLAYFTNPAVQGLISNIFFKDWYSFAQLAEKEEAEEDLEQGYLATFIGKGKEKHIFTNVLHAIVLLLPWLILVYGIMFGFELTARGTRFLPAFFSYLTMIVAFGLIDWVWRWQIHRANEKEEYKADDAPTDAPSASSADLETLA